MPPKGQAGTNPGYGLPAGRLAGWPGSQLLETLFNPAGQQRGGLLAGLLRTVPGRGRDHPVIASLLQGPFNSNPVLAGYLAGLLAVRLAREARASEAEETEVAIEGIRQTLAPLLSGMGDRIIWGGLRPALSLIGILSAFLWVGEPALWYWVGYNAVQVYWRRRSWTIGLAGDEAVRAEIRGPVLRAWARGLAGAGRFLLGLTIGAIGTGLWLSHGPEGCGVFLSACVLGFVLARSGRVGGLALGWIGLGLAGLLALVRFGWKEMRP